ncbi:F0F1 ATP synthase subunit A [Clostridium akagii]|uniref:F0F1 ATP synthase subunit A n=1 Tax=Clostridium akagii TaxID=91623 RepID=UPI00047CBAB0|nr:F0F1 ATP synthase subunit A [Clostridium akagii]
MDLNAKTLFTLRLGGHNIGITDSIVTQWVIMVVIVILVLALTRNLKKLPDKKQSVLEMLIDFFNGLVRENMGEKYMSFVPFIGTMGIFLFFLNLTGLVGVDPSTKDISVTAGFAIISFVVINVNSFSKVGIGGFGKELISPYILMLPMNLLEKITLPISLCLRLFCNMLVGFIIIGLIYQGMGHFAFIVPIPFHLFFDMFDGVIQVYIFMMLTMLYTKMGGELE